MAPAAVKATGSVSAEHGMGLLNNALTAFRSQQVPSVNRTLGLLCLILNIFIPGSGTIVS